MLPLRQSSSILAHPLVIFPGTWTVAFGLYELHLSGQLIYEARNFLSLYAVMIGAFLAGYAYSAVFTRYIPIGLRVKQGAFGAFAVANAALGDAHQSVWRQTRILFLAWSCLTVLEIILSGGIPILWLLTGSSKNYRDFGLPSLHGFVMSMLLATAMTSFALYASVRDRKYLAIPVFSLIWFVLVITRNFLVGSLLQMTFLFLVLRRPTFRQILKLVVLILALTVLLGVVGDIRSGGSDLIRAVGQPTERFPDWLPTGFLWVYIYLTTPLNNLFHTITLYPYIENPSLAGTTAQLLPTVIRTLIFSPSALQTDLVDDNLNVSTGFIGPYMDFGLPGVAMLAGLTGIMSNIFWHARALTFFMLGYAFLAQAAFLSVFFNHLLYLPYLFQLFWFWWIFHMANAPRAAPDARPRIR